MTDKLCKISIFSAILTSIVGAPVTSIADSRVNSSYASAYNQVLAVQQQQAYADSVETPQIQTASTTDTLPVEVEDARLAEQIKNNTANSVTVSDLEQCSMIDIRGVFKWGVPQSGMRQTSQPQCIAVVDLVDYNTNKVLASTTVAAGDAIKCNIDEFPESGYLPALADVILPADNPPTEKDVEKALNKEQKQNSGFKIAAAALIGGLAGNALSPKESGDSKLLGTGKKQLAGSAIGALAAGGLMAASSYSGKVAGETIKSTAVNAAAGMIVGNMAAGMSDSNSVLATTKCVLEKQERDCVVGHFYKKTQDLKKEENGKKYTYYTTRNGNSTYRCEDGEDGKCFSYSANLQNIYLKSNEANNESVALSTQNSGDFTGGKFTGVFIRNAKIVKEGENNPEEPVYYEITTAWEAKPAQMAYAIIDNLPSKAFGYKVSDFENLVKSKKVIGYYVRYNNTTTVGNRLDFDAQSKNKINESEYNFTPAARSSEDGGIVDLSNEARAKATMAGAGAGAALGGFVGYQGAQSEISERWVTAMNEYTDSLNNFYCTTGKRFLSFYNSYAEVPRSQTLSTGNQE